MWFQFLHLSHLSICNLCMVKIHENIYVARIFIFSRRLLIYWTNHHFPTWPYHHILNSCTWFFYFSRLSIHAQVPHWFNYAGLKYILISFRRSSPSLLFLFRIFLYILSCFSPHMKFRICLILKIKVLLIFLLGQIYRCLEIIYLFEILSLSI